MIETFRYKGLEDFFFDGTVAKIQPKHAQKLKDILDRLDAANVAEDMNYPGSRFHRLKGDRKEFYSVTVQGNWRVIFRFENGHAYDVDYLDYH